MKRRKLISVFMCAALLTAPNASAQFFKKLGKALQEVDKALGSSEQTKEKESQAQAQEQNAVTSGNKQSTQNGIYEGNLGRDAANFITPHITSNTKVIYVEESPGLGLHTAAFSDGMAFVSNKKEKFFIDSLGNKAFQFKYTLPFNASSPKFYKGVCPVHEIGNVTWLINKKGEQLVKLPGIFRVTNFVDGVAAGLITVQKGYTKYSQLVHINTKGQLIFPGLSEPVRSSLEDLRPLCEGLAAYYSYTKRLYGFRDKNGQVIISPSYVKVKDFSDGMAAVQQGDGKWGFIDAKGNMVIASAFTNEPSSFSEGYAVVQKRDGVRCFIDKKGDVVQDNFQQASTFHNGYAYVVFKVGDSNMKVIDKNFKVVSKIEHSPYDKALEQKLFFKDDMILYAHQSYISPLGDELLAADLIYLFCDGLAICSWNPSESRERFVGYINKKGEYIVRFKEKVF